MKKKILVFLLAVVLTFTMFSSVFAVSASAEGATNRNIFANYDHSCDDNLREAIVNMVEDVTDDKYGLTKNDYAQKFNYLLYSDPDCIGVADLCWTYILRYDNSTVTKSYTLTYADGYEGRREQYEQALENALKAIYALLPENATDFEKILVAHDYLVSTTRYDKDSVNKEYDGTEKPRDHWAIYDATGALVDNKAVCKGYSLSFKAIMEKMGIECLVAASGKSDHAWNIVKLDGEWYHVDCSANDQAYDMLGCVSHGLFLVSTQYLLENSPNRSDFVVAGDDPYMVFTDDKDATSTKYDNVSDPWRLTRSVCHYYNGSLYTVSPEMVLQKDGEFFYATDEPMIWYPQSFKTARYINPMSRISGYGNTIYMTGPKNVYKVNLDTGVGEVIFTPDTSEGLIFGLARINGKLYCAVDAEEAKTNETWIYIPGQDVSYDDIIPPNPPVKKGLQDSSGNIKDSLSFTLNMNGSQTVNFSGLESGESLSIKSDNENIATATVSGSQISIKSVLDGSAKITVSLEKGGKTVSSYTVNITVNKNYTKTKNVTLTEGESVTLTDENGDYSKNYSAVFPNSLTFEAKVEGKTQIGTPATPASFSKVSSVSNGKYVIAYENGGSKYYLVASGTNLSYTTNVNSATEFTVSGSNSSLTIKSGNYYLAHSTSALSLTTSSSNADWKYDGSKFYFSQSSRSWLIFSKTTNYYMTYSNGFKVGTSSNATPAAYIYTEGTPAVPGEAYTNITISGKQRGTAYIIVGNTLYNVTVNKAASTQVITVHTVDDKGVKLAEDYTISGKTGTAYTVSAPAKYGYIAPQSVSGYYTDSDTAEITLTYTLNTDKSALTNATSALLPSDTYTVESYAKYKTAYDNAKAVLNNSRATQTQVDNALSEFNTAKGNLKKLTFTVTVNYVDDLGNKIGTSQSKTGEIGTSYTFTHSAIASYISPKTETGVFTENKVITLVYTLSTDKTALNTLLASTVAQGEYTDDSYSAYMTAVNNGQAVADNARALQSEIDAAVNSINSAKANLKVKSKASFVKVTSGISSGKEYVLTYNGKALSVSNGKLTADSVTDQNGGLSNVKDESIWIVTQSGSEYAIKNKATGQYLTTTSSGFIFKTYSLTTTSSATTWTASQSGTTFRFARNSRYISYSNGFGLSTSTSKAGLTIYVAQ